MSTKVSPRHVVTVLEVSGRVSLGEAAELRDGVERALKDGAKILILDLALVAYMDSTGLSELTSALNAARKHKCELKLLRPTRKIEDLLHITHLADTFQIFNDERAAIGSFKV